MHELTLNIQRTQGAEVVRLNGAVEPAGFANLASTVVRLVFEETPRIVLDCQEVTYIGSAELKELVDLANFARAHGGDIKCVGLSPTILQVANLVGGGDSIDCYKDLTDALSAFRNGTDG